jgi:hypothetical protein
MFFCLALQLGYIMKYLLFFSLIILTAACNNLKKDEKTQTNINTTGLSIIKEVQRSDSIQKQWESQVYKNWVESDSMPYFILDKQIERLLKNPELTETDRLVLNFRLIYNYYYRRYIYDSLQYREIANDLLFQTFNSDSGLIRTSAYFKTTPEEMEKYINEVKNAKTVRIQDSLIWYQINYNEQLR